MNPYDLAEEIVRDITDGDPLADLTEEDAVQLIEKARAQGYDVPDILTPDLFLALFEFMKPEPEEDPEPKCAGDGWHKVGNCKVLVENRVIVKCLRQNTAGEWIPCQIKRWNRKYHWYESAGIITLAAFRSGLNRSTITYG